MTTYLRPVPCTVRGDWMDEDEPGYPAVMVRRWNGFAVPAFDRAVMGRVVEDQLRQVEGYPDAPSLRWDGDSVVYSSPDLDEDVVLQPGADGRYVVDLGWCWDTEGELEDPGAPTRAQKEAWVAWKTEHVLDPFGAGSWDMDVLEDGSHRFRVTEDLGRDESTPGNRRVTRVVTLVTVGRDGSLAEERP